jgi:hypothetical protein
VVTALVDISGEWVGSNYGTHPGNTFASITHGTTPDSFRLDISLNSGGVVYNAITVQDIVTTGHEAELIAKASTQDAEKVVGSIVITAADASKIDASWKLVSGAAGVLRLNRAAASVKSATVSGEQIVEEIVGADLPFGPTTVFKPELQGILKKIRSLFDQASDLTITVSTDSPGRESIVQLDQNFLHTVDLPPIISNLEVSAVDRSKPIYSSVLVKMNEDGMACCRFRGHRDKVFNGTGGFRCREGSSAASSSLRR